MRVLFNATDAVLNTRALQRYVCALSNGLPALRGQDEVDLAFFTHRVFQVRSFLQGMHPDLRYRPRFLWLPRRLLKRRFASPGSQLRRLTADVDLYHESTFDSPAIEGIPVVTTIHGLAHTEIPEMLPAPYVAEKNGWLESVLERSTHFICVSRKTESELQSRFGVAPERTCAIPLGVGSQFRPLPRHTCFQTIFDRFGLDGPYLLYVGGIQPNKNIPLLLRTFSRLVLERGFRGKLVLVGDVHYPERDYQEMLAETGVEDRIEHVGFFHPEDPVLAHLYRAATLFLFPTFYEGWTSPPLEAMACGTPVVASNCSSIPETVGGAAVLVHPANELGWLEACHRMVEDTEARCQAIQAGLMRAGMFSWQKTVRATWRFYRDIVDGTLESDPDEEETRSIDLVV